MKRAILLLLSIAVAVAESSVAAQEEAAAPSVPLVADEPTLGEEPLQLLEERPLDSNGVSVWGLTGAYLFFTGERMAPNGIPYDPLFSLDLDLNLGIDILPRCYLFTNDRFLCQKPGAGITNPTQGNLDFSKREIDLIVGMACNYYGNFELRGLAYSMGNINRGVSLERPVGFKDGVGIENRYYFGNEYALPVQTRYDVARTNFVSIGYYPSKEMIGGDHEAFSPGAFARGYLTYEILGVKCYLFGDVELIADRQSFEPKLLNTDLGIASRPFEKVRGLEFRTGADSIFDVDDGIARTLWYIAARFVF